MLNDGIHEGIISEEDWELAQRLGQQMDSLDITDRFYEKKYQDMETRLYHLYDEIEGVENSISEVKNRLRSSRMADSCSSAPLSLPYLFCK